MCHGRLAAGEPPACAQACPTHAIRIVTVAARMTATSNRIQLAERSPAAKPRVRQIPAPSHTGPTTRYVSRRSFPETLVTPNLAAEPATPHWPLVIMLTLIPAAVGLAGAASWDHHVAATSTPAIAFASWLAGGAGLGTSMFHLGQPRRAWRIFLGWRRSWLSREAMLFGLWFTVASAALIAPRLLLFSAILGSVALASSAMIYIDTRRRFWRASQTATRLFGTASLFGLVPTIPLAAAAVLGLKMAWESRTVFDQSRSARLQRGALARAAGARDLLGVVTIVLLVAGPEAAACVTLLAGELAERYLFFRAVDAVEEPADANG